MLGILIASGHRNHKTGRLQVCLIEIPSNRPKKTLGKRPLLIDPLHFAIESCPAGKPDDILTTELVAALGPDCLAFTQLALEILSNGYGLVPERAQMHFNAV